MCLSLFLITRNWIVLNSPCWTLHIRWQTRYLKIHLQFENFSCQNMPLKAWLQYMKFSDNDNENNDNDNYYYYHNYDNDNDNDNKKNNDCKYRYTCNELFQYAHFEPFYVRIRHIFFLFSLWLIIIPRHFDEATSTITLASIVKYMMIDPSLFRFFSLKIPNNMRFFYI